MRGILDSQHTKSIPKLQVCCLGNLLSPPKKEKKEGNPIQPWIPSNNSLILLPAILGFIFHHFQGYKIPPWGRKVDKQTNNATLSSIVLGVRAQLHTMPFFSFKEMKDVLRVGVCHFGFLLSSPCRRRSRINAMQHRISSGVGFYSCDSGNNCTDVMLSLQFILGRMGAAKMWNHGHEEIQGCHNHPPARCAYCFCCVTKPYRPGDSERTGSGCSRPGWCSSLNSTCSWEGLSHPAWGSTRNGWWLENWLIFRTKEVRELASAAWACSCSIS